MTLQCGREAEDEMTPKPKYSSEAMRKALEACKRQAERRKKFQHRWHEIKHRQFTI